MVDECHQEEVFLTTASLTQVGIPRPAQRSALLGKVCTHPLSHRLSSAHPQCPIGSPLHTPIILSALLCTPTLSYRLSSAHPHCSIGSLCLWKLVAPHDPWVLEVISWGYKYQFHKRPPPISSHSHCRPPSMWRPESKINLRALNHCIHIPKSKMQTSPIVTSASPRATGLPPSTLPMPIFTFPSVGTSHTTYTSPIGVQSYQFI